MLKRRFTETHSILAALLAALVVAPLTACGAEPTPPPQGSSASSTAQSVAVATADPYPMAQMANEHLSMDIHLPDAEKGYYRAMRFDWSGLVSRVRVGEHTFFGPRTAKHNPLSHDDIQGTAEEFGIDGTIGYDEAAVGETFVKIGVGELKKATDAKYSFGKNYELVKAGEWKVDHKPGTMVFDQVFEGPRGWGYDYSKTITLDDHRAGFTISRTLKNTGQKTIDTAHYGHNFIVVDDQPALGPQYRVEFGFEPQSKEFAKPGIPKIEGNALVLTQEMPRNKSMWGQLAGFDPQADYKLRVVNTTSNVAIEISGDGPVEKMVVWGMNPTICPEIFVPIKLEPGESKTWKTTYFFDVGTK